MGRDDLSPLLQDVLYADQHRLLDDSVGRAARRVVSFNLTDSFISDLVRERVHSHRVEQAFAGPLLAPKLSGGDLLLGVDVNHAQIRHPKQYLNGHSLVLAGSGGGKTMRARFLVLQMALLLVGLWLFDFRKREFSVLRPHLNRVGAPLLVVPGRRLRLNPLQVPHYVAPGAWASRVADLLVVSLRLPTRSAKLLNAVVFELYRKFNVTQAPKPGDKARYPTLFDLRQSVISKRDANHQARQATIDSLDPVLLSIGSVLCYRRGWATSDLARHRIVFELADLSEVDKDLLLSSLVLPEFTSRVARGVSNSDMDLFIVCDEAARLVSCANQGTGIADLIGLVRGTGVGLDLSVQSSDVTPMVLSNTANKWIGRCGSALDYDTIGSAMGLTSEQRRWIPLHLEPGTFVVQVGEGKWRHPFLVRIPLMRFPSAPPDRMIVDDTDALAFALGADTEIAEEFVHWQPDADIDVSSSEDRVTRQGAELSDAEVRFLRAVIDNPGQPSSALPRLAGIGPRTAQTIRKRLIALEYLRQHSINTGPRGRRAIVLEPLDKARAAVQAAAKEAGA